MYSRTADGLLWSALCVLLAGLGFMIRGKILCGASCDAGAAMLFIFALLIEKRAEKKYRQQ